MPRRAPCTPTPRLREILTTMSARPACPTPAWRCHCAAPASREQGILDSGHAAAHSPRARPAGFRSAARMKWVVIILVVVVVGAVGAYWYEGYRAESALLEQPVYRVLKKHEPAVYEKLVAEYKIYEREETQPREFHQPRQLRDQPRGHAEPGARLAGRGARARERHAGDRAAVCRKRPGTPASDTGSRWSPGRRTSPGTSSQRRRRTRSSSWAK